MKKQIKIRKRISQKDLGAISGGGYQVGCSVEGLTGVKKCAIIVYPH